jgi:hypothetical protein
VTSSKSAKVQMPDIGNAMTNLADVLAGAKQLLLHLYIVTAVDFLFIFDHLFYLKNLS